MFLVDIAELQQITVLLLQVVNQHMEHVVLLQTPLHQLALLELAPIIDADLVLVLVHLMNVVL